MREHMGLYRGKRIDNGEWVEGWLVIKKDPILEVTYCFILAYGKGESFVTWYPVDPDTVGECTGLRDKNGKLIFEGDIVTATDGILGSPFVDGITGKIVYDETAFFIEPKDIMETEYLFNECAVYEIIGNIHDNPELLKGG